MAEPSTSPALPSTADEIPYVPVSWMAVAASAVSNLYVTVLLSLGVAAFLAKKPLVQPELLALPAVGIVLAFAARRVIRNSEGTRTGERLANSAWWTCVVAGLGYAAYLLAIDYSVRRDARNELVRWVDNIRAGDERSFNVAFLRTRDPARRAGISPDSTAEIKGLFRDEYTTFEQCDLVRMLRRNKGENEFVPGGVREWVYRPTGIECVYTGTVKSPEGAVQINVSLRGMDAGSAAEGAGRQWGIMLNPTGFIAPDKVSYTRYGWLIQGLEASAGMVGREFITRIGLGPWAVPYVYQSMIRPGSDSRTWDQIMMTTPQRTAVVGGLGVAMAYGAKDTPNLTKFFPAEFFKPLGDGDPEVKRGQFKVIWEGAGLLPPEGRLKNSPDKNAVLTLTDGAVEVRVPCELPFPGTDGSMSAARGRLVVVSTDPALLEELKRLKAEADPNKGLSTPPEELLSRTFKWRVARVESDMVRVQMEQQRPGAPGGGGGMPPGLGGR